MTSDASLPSPTEGEVRAIILERLGDTLRARGIDPGTGLADDFDLLFEGGMDSFAFLAILGTLGERYGLDLDVSDIEPDELTRLGPFSRHVVRIVATARGDG